MSEQEQKMMGGRQTAARRLNATGNFHERMQKALAAVGKHDDAAAAGRAADLCKKSARHV